MVLVIGNVCAGALYADNVQLALALITDFNLADARLYSKYNLALLQKEFIKLLFFPEQQISMQLESQALEGMCVCALECVSVCRCASGVYVKFNFSLCLFIVRQSISTSVLNL